MAAIERVVVVTRKTAQTELVERLNSREQARFYLRQNGVSFSEYEAADAQYERALAALRAHSRARSSSSLSTARCCRPTSLATTTW